MDCVVIFPFQWSGIHAVYSALNVPSRAKPRVTLTRRLPSVMINNQNRGNKMPSFDIVSELNMQEVDNAINQAKKEIIGRYDFKGSKAELNWDKKEVTLLAEDEYKIVTMMDILQNKMAKRGLDLRALKLSEIEPAGGKALRQKVTLVQGIEKEMAKDIVKFIKDSKLKVQAQIMDEKLRVTSKSIDELQSTMQAVKAHNFSVPLQFDNMRS